MQHLEMSPLWASHILTPFLQQHELIGVINKTWQTSVPPVLRESSVCGALPLTRAAHRLGFICQQTLINQQSLAKNGCCKKCLRPQDAAAGAAHGDVSMARVCKQQQTSTATTERRGSRSYKSILLWRLQLHFTLCMKSQRIQLALKFISDHKTLEYANSRIPHLLGRYRKKVHHTPQVAVKPELKTMQMSWGSGGMFPVWLVCGGRWAHSRLTSPSPRGDRAHPGVCGTTV